MKENKDKCKDGLWSFLDKHKYTRRILAKSTGKAIVIIAHGLAIGLSISLAVFMVLGAVALFLYSANPAIRQILNNIF